MRLTLTTNAVGLAVSSGKDVRIKVLSCSSPLEDGNWTGETVVIKQVSGVFCQLLTRLEMSRLSESWQILSPLSKKDIGVIRCVGLNFKDHAVSSWLLNS